MSAARRFVLVSPNYYPRVCGIGDHSARLGSELLRRGHEVTVFSRQPVERHPEAPEVEALAADGRLPTVIAEHVAAEIARRRPTDVILQYTAQMWDTWRFGTPALVWLAARARRAGARVTLVAHEPFVPWLARPDLALSAALQRVQLGALLKASHRFFLTTETRAAQIAPACRLLRAPAPAVIRVGANALPIPRPHDGAAAAPPSPSRPRLGVFSTADVGKKFDVVLEAFARIASELTDAELVLIGDLGPPGEARVRDILAEVERHPARARIRITGRLPLSAIAAEVAALDVFLFPMSTGANTRSGTLPVALGSGVAVVAAQGAETDAALFRHGENVFFARELGSSAFAESALRLLHYPALRARVAEGGLRLYAEHLSWARIADQLL